MRCVPVYCIDTSNIRLQRPAASTDGFIPAKIFEREFYVFGRHFLTVMPLNALFQNKGPYARICVRLPAAEDSVFAVCCAVWRRTDQPIILSATIEQVRCGG